MKPWYQSKTLWANALGIAAMLLQSEAGFLLPPEYQAGGLAVTNMLLRLVTKQPIAVKAPSTGALGIALIVGGLLMAPLLSGCSMSLIDKRPVLTEMAVRVAVARVLEERPGWTQQAREISLEMLRSLDETEQVNLVDLEREAYALVPWEDLTVEERELVAVLIRAVRLEIEADLARSGVSLPEHVKVRMATVLGWIYQVADARLQRQAAIGGSTNMVE